MVCYMGCAPLHTSSTCTPQYVHIGASAVPPKRKEKERKKKMKREKESQPTPNLRTSPRTVPYRNLRRLIYQDYLTLTFNKYFSFFSSSTRSSIVNVVAPTPWGSAGPTDAADQIGTDSRNGRTLQVGW